ncbi:MAG: 30S ribosomal protein S12 methylthiotransferase RimO [Lachnospiraceae bacterium]|nr:30S ribosomal protein S12 methylthiotransferase RimO [Lachnospiraceae bacterium]
MKVLFVSLGCDKNTVDSEMMLGLLSAEGYTFTDDEEEADIAIVNSCCFISDAEEESINTIIELGKRRLSGQLKALIVTGCLSQRYKDEMHKELPEVDAIVGTNSQGDIVDVLSSVLENHSEDRLRPLDEAPFLSKRRVMTTGGHYEYLKIADGCNKKCTYCIIPKIRGPYRSYPIEELINEAVELARKGVKELILVAQETTLYGIDIYGKKMLPELLIKLCKIEGIEWIRLLYCYPEEITDELISVIKTEKKVLNYLDIPVQSGSDRILKLMGRKTTHDEILELIQKLRREIPDICLRTTLISGFPGETNKDHLESIRIVKEARFDRLGCFTYSPQEGTVAAGFDGQISERTKRNRLKKIMEAQQDVVFEHNDSMNGIELDAFIEGYIREDDIYVARTYRDAPDVDGLLFVSSDKELQSGMNIRVRVIGFNEYDLIGECI